MIHIQLVKVCFTLIGAHLTALLENDDACLEISLVAKYKILPTCFSVLFFIIHYQMFSLIINSTNKFGGADNNNSVCLCFEDVVFDFKEDGVNVTA